MEKLVAKYIRLRDRASAIHAEFVNKYSVDTDTLPLGAFYGFEQLMDSASRILGFYENDWNATSITGPTWYHQAINRERASHTKIVTNGTFVQFMSMIEHAAAQSVGNTPTIHPPRRGRTKIYLSQLFNSSSTAGWVPVEDVESWEGIIEFRNSLVHRNGISDKTKTFRISDEFGLQFAAGHVITANLNLVPDLTEWAIESFARWSDAYLAYVQPQGWATLAKT